MLKVKVNRKAVEIAITKRNMSQNTLAMRMEVMSQFSCKNSWPGYLQC